MKRDWKLLFSDLDLARVLENGLKKVNDAVRKIDGSDFETRTDDSLAASVASQLTILPLELLEEKISVSQREVRVDVSHDRNRHFFTPGPHYLDGIEITYHLPYSGDSGLLKCRPSTFSSLIPRANITRNELRFPYDRVDRDDISSTKEEFDSDLSAIRQWIGWVNQQVNTYNTSLKPHALALVEQRRQEIAKTKTAIDNLGYPTKDV